MPASQDGPIVPAFYPLFGSLASNALIVRCCCQAAETVSTAVAGFTIAVLNIDVNPRFRLMLSYNAEVRKSAESLCAPQRPHRIFYRPVGDRWTGDEVAEVRS
jgi:hypothetical protein